MSAVHNDRVRSSSRSALSLVALSTFAALALGGCSSDSGDGKASGASSPASSTTSPSPSSTVKVPDTVKLTDQGTTLGFGDTARVIFETTETRGTVLELKVVGVQQGTLADFKGFILDDSYKKNAAYYYARVQVKNVGEGVVGGVGVPLWGVNESNTLLPAVNFTTSFAKCPSKPLPRRFAPGDALSTCLVYLSPNRGKLKAVSYRPSQEYNPITWTGPIAKAPAPKKAKASPNQTG